jgi:hypothetical protein
METISAVEAAGGWAMFPTIMVAPIKPSESAIAAMLPTGRVGGKSCVFENANKAQYVD